MKKLIKNIIGINNILKFRQIIRCFSGNFLTSKPLATEKEYLKLHKEYVEEINNDNFIKNNFSSSDIKFINDLALITQVTKKASKINWRHGFIIMKTLRSYANDTINNLNIFETGTARGFSAVTMSYVLKELNKNFNIHTLDIIPHEKKIYWNCITDIKKGKVTRKMLLTDYSNYLKNIIFISGISKNILTNLNLKRIHFAFLDGSHEYEDVKFEFEFVDKRNKTGDILVLDDYTPGKFDGVVKLVDEIKLKKNYNLDFLDNNKDRGYAILKKK